MNDLNKTKEFIYFFKILCYNMIVIYMKEIIEILKEKNKTISTMESCTGGFLANTITNIEGASDVFKFGAITYSNEYKIKLGVPSNIIDKYSVYSIETANEMSKNICKYTNSNYGIGITGKLNKPDKNNMYSDDSTVYISIYNNDNNTYIEEIIKVIYKDREENKKYIINKIIELLRGAI